jgi:hypothetical protein
MAEAHRHSRFQVISNGIPAKTDPEQPGDHIYYYDGRRFWRRAANGKTALLPSWRVPQYGWRWEGKADHMPAHDDLLAG